MYLCVRKSEKARDVICVYTSILFQTNSILKCYCFCLKVHFSAANVVY